MIACGESSKLQRNIKLQMRAGAFPVILLWCVSFTECAWP
jgi:hypothetical protein